MFRNFDNFFLNNKKKIINSHPFFPKNMVRVGGFFYSTFFTFFFATLKTRNNKKSWLIQTFSYNIEHFLGIIWPGERMQSHYTYS